jgi:hypothetical protein
MVELLGWHSLARLRSSWVYEYRDDSHKYKVKTLPNWHVYQGEQLFLPHK